MNTATATAAIGTCRRAGHTFRAEGEQMFWCPTCEPVTSFVYGQEHISRSIIKWASIKARVTNTPCDPDCTSAKSYKCACACGGANHGINYTAGEGAAR